MAIFYDLMVQNKDGGWDRIYRDLSFIGARSVLRWEIKESPASKWKVVRVETETKRTDESLDKFLDENLKDQWKLSL